MHESIEVIFIFNLGMLPFVMCESLYWCRCARVCMCVCAFVHKCVCVRACVCVCVCVRACMCVCVLLCACMHTLFSEWLILLGRLLYVLNVACMLHACCVHVVCMCMLYLLGWQAFAHTRKICVVPSIHPSRRLNPVDLAACLLSQSMSGSLCVHAAWY